MVNYIKKNPKIIAVIIGLVIVIVSMFISNRQERTEINLKHRTEVTKLDSLRSVDSLYINSMQTKLDSMSKMISVYKEQETINTTVKKGLSTTTVTVVDEQPGGGKTTTTTVTEIDTTTLVTEYIRTVIDSMETEMQKKVDSVRIEYANKKDTVYVTKTDTVHEVDSNAVVLTNPIKKFELTAAGGVQLNTELDIKPVIDVGATYDIVSPLFIQAGVSKTGNLVTFNDVSHYTLKTSVGVRLKF